MAYTPLTYSYDELPETAGNSIKYQLSEARVPANVTEVLVYLWATTSSDPEFHRYYYKISTIGNKTKYTQYMNVAATNDVSLNSANLWLPVFPVGEDPGYVEVELIDPDDWSSGKKDKSIAHRRPCIKHLKDGTQGKVATFSEFFVIGYRN